METKENIAKQLAGEWQGIKESICRKCGHIQSRDRKKCQKCKEQDMVPLTEASIEKYRKKVKVKTESVLVSTNTNTWYHLNLPGRCRSRDWII